MTESFSVWLRGFVKEVHRGSGSGLYNLVSWNAPPLEDQRLEWAARVAGIRPR